MGSTKIEAIKSPRSANARRVGIDEPMTSASVPPDVTQARLVHLAAIQRVRETWHRGEPPWMKPAKEIYAHLGNCLFLLSEDPLSPPIDETLRKKCVEEIRRFVKRLAKIGPDTIELRYFLSVLDNIVTEHPPTSDVVRVYGTVGAVAHLLQAGGLGHLAQQARDETEKLEGVLAAWRNHTARQPTTWKRIADLWRDISGQTLSPGTIRSIWNKGLARTHGKRGSRKYAST